MTRAASLVEAEQRVRCYLWGSLTAQYVDTEYCFVRSPDDAMTIQATAPTRPFPHAATIDRPQPTLPQRAARRLLLLRQPRPPRDRRGPRRARHVRSDRRRLRPRHRRRSSRRRSRQRRRRAPHHPRSPPARAVLPPCGRAAHGARARHLRHRREVLKARRDEGRAGQGRRRGWQGPASAAAASAAAERERERGRGAGGKGIRDPADVHNAGAIVRFFERPRLRCRRCF